MKHRNKVHVNQQIPTPRKYVESGFLDVHSTFYTIQGEGPLSGRPAIFVRLSDCNLQCPGCDTDYTTTREPWHPEGLAIYLMTKYKAPTTPLVVITGGEPFRQNLVPLIGHLQAKGCQVQIETNGTLNLPPGAGEHGVNWPLVDIVCSPKTGSVNKMLERFITAYKYIVTAGDVGDLDGLPLHALRHPANPMLARPRQAFPVEKIFVQPMDPDPGGHNLNACIQSCYQFGYTLSLQQHKIIGVP